MTPQSSRFDLVAHVWLEIIRAGVQPVSRGQLSAANALGMSYLNAIRLIVLPQAMRAAVPALLTQGIVLGVAPRLRYG